MPSPFHLLAKPTGAACNLDCAYCFFLSKEELYPGSAFRMSDEVLEAYLRQLFAAHRGLPAVEVAWQGGEPTLMGLDFFERSVALAEAHREPGQQVTYTIQTNGVRLDAAWCAFFKRHGFLVGLSVDGPKPMHDAYRVDRGGAGSFDQVMRAWERLRAHEVDVNVLCTVHAANGDHPLDVYRFFRDGLGARFLQFIPIVERVAPEGPGQAPPAEAGSPPARRPLYTQRGSGVTGRSVGPSQFGRFLCAVFDEWVRRDVGEVFVQAFDVALGSWLGQHNLCIVSPTCGRALALEHNGDVYACDHYVEPAHRVGNLLETPLASLVDSERQQAFGRAKLDSLPRYCRECEVLFACYGECPRNRFVQTPDGEAGLNYLCEGYRAFFAHVREPMDVMADALRRGRPPTEVMAWQAARDAERFRGAGRNDACPCGSGKKFKQCHGR